MVDFEDAHPFTHCAAPGISIQARSQNHELTHTALDGIGQRILREARPDRDEDSHPSSGWILLGFPRDAFAVFTENAHGKRIGENAALLQQLMSGAVTGRSQCPSGSVLRIAYNCESTGAIWNRPPIPGGRVRRPNGRGAGDSADPSRNARQPPQAFGGDQDDGDETKQVPRPWVCRRLTNRSNSAKTTNM